MRVEVSGEWKWWMENGVIFLLLPPCVVQGGDVLEKPKPLISKESRGILAQLAPLAPWSWFTMSSSSAYPSDMMSLPIISSYASTFHFFLPLYPSCSPLLIADTSQASKPLYPNSIWLFVESMLSLSSSTMPSCPISGHGACYWPATMLCPWTHHSIWQLVIQKEEGSTKAQDTAIHCCWEADAFHCALPLQSVIMGIVVHIL